MNDTTTNLPEPSAAPMVSVENNVIRLSDGVRITGLILSSIGVATAVGLAIWVIYNRKAPVVQMMQPVFLLMLCTGSTISSLAIIPYGANDENSNNVNASCLSFIWLYYLGTTISLSALFSKLWRVNEIFHAEGFQRKVVTIKDVLGPFLILFTINVTLLTIISIMDPPVWQEVTVADDEEQGGRVAFGHCDYSSMVGELLDAALALMALVPLVILCVQAYRARDIKSEFSEARGVALALFLWFQSVIIVVPSQEVMGEENVDAQHTLKITQTFVNTISLLFFIFAPIISHHRQRCRNGGKSVNAGTATRKTKTHISGLDFDYPSTDKGMAAATPPLPAATKTITTTPQRHQLDDEQPEQYAANDQKRISEMELELQALRTRIKELELLERTELNPAETNHGETKQHEEEIP